MMKKYREWAAKPYTRGDMVTQTKWALIITLIGFPSPRGGRVASVDQIQE